MLFQASIPVSQANSSRMAPSLSEINVLIRHGGNRVNISLHKIAASVTYDPAGVVSAHQGSIPRKAREALEQCESLLKCKIQICRLQTNTDQGL